MHCATTNYLEKKTSIIFVYIYTRPVTWLVMRRFATIAPSQPPFRIVICTATLRGALAFYFFLYSFPVIHLGFCSCSNCAALCILQKSSAIVSSVLGSLLAVRLDFIVKRNTALTMSDFFPSSVVCWVDGNSVGAGFVVTDENVIFSRREYS